MSHSLWAELPFHHEFEPDSPKDLAAELMLRLKVSLMQSIIYCRQLE